MIKNGNGNGKGSKIRDWAALITAIGGIMLGAFAYMKDAKDPKAEASHGESDQAIQKLSSDVRKAVDAVQENRQAISSLKVFFMGYALGSSSKTEPKKQLKKLQKKAKVRIGSGGGSVKSSKPQAVPGRAITTILRQMEAQKRLKSLKLPPKRRLKSWKNLRIQQKR